MNKTLRTIGLAAVLFSMLAAYISGALLLLCGGTYLIARSKNPSAVDDFTDTAAFRTMTREAFDALYAAVTEGTEPEGIDESIAYFAYSLDTNILYCSDPLVSDIPAFEETYGTGDPYIYFCRYSADTFRGTNTNGTEPETFEYSYINAATELFDNTQRNYTGTAILIAVMRPARLAFDGFGASLLESLILRQGIVAIVLLAGVFFVSLAIVLLNSPRRRRIDRRISDAVSWLYLELRLLVLGAAVLLCVRYWAFPFDYRFWAILSILPLPILYVLRCSMRYAGGAMFFKRSAILHLVRFTRREIDEIFPVSSLQLAVRTQAIRLVIFGLVLPFALFFLGDLLLGTEVVRLLIPFFPLYFGVLFFLFYRKYAELVNGISELERASALLPLGEQVPELDFDEDDPLYPLVKNLYTIDRAVDARADTKFKSAHRKLALLADRAGELREQLRLLEADIRTAEGGNADPVALYVGLKRMTELVDAISGTAVPDRPVTAPALKRIDLLPVIAEVEAARGPELSIAQLRVHADVPDKPVLITADPLHIRAVLDIFYSNAAMYALAGSTVELHVRREGDNWRFIMMNTTAAQLPEAESPESALSSGLAQARTYLALNGGELDYTCQNGRFGVSFVLPAAH